MSGHSKWHSIKHKKAATDAKRGHIFTKLANTISVAARESGGDPNMNIRLRLAVETAKKANMPNVNIDRAIKRGTGELGGSVIETFNMEAFGPGGVGLIIEVITDNKNRALSDIRNILSKNGGTAAGQGAVSHNFALRGVLRVETEMLTEEQEVAIIDSGALDYSLDDGLLTVVTERNDLKKVEVALKDCGLAASEAQLEYIAKNYVEVDSETEERVLALMAALDDNDDVANVYGNEQSV